MTFKSGRFGNKSLRTIIRKSDMRSLSCISSITIWVALSSCLYKISKIIRATFGYIKKFNLKYLTNFANVLSHSSLFELDDFLTYNPDWQCDFNPYKIMSKCPTLAYTSISLQIISIKSQWLKSPCQSGLEIEMPSTSKIDNFVQTQFSTQHLQDSSKNYTKPSDAYLALIISL